MHQQWFECDGFHRIRRHVRRIETNGNPRQGYCITYDCIRFFVVVVVIIVNVVPSHVQDERPHTFSLDATSARNTLMLISSVPEFIASTADIWYLNGRHHRRHLTCESKVNDVDLCQQWANRKGIVWIVNGRWKWIGARNIRIQFPATYPHTHTHTRTRTISVHLCPHFRPIWNGLRTNSF